MMLKLVLLVICPIPGCAHLTRYCKPTTTPHAFQLKKKKKTNKQTEPQLNEQAQFDNFLGLVEGDP